MNEANAKLQEAARLPWDERKQQTVTLIHELLRNRGIGPDVLLGLRNITGELADKAEEHQAASTCERQALDGMAAASVTLMVWGDTREKIAVDVLQRKLRHSKLDTRELRAVRKRVMAGSRGEVASRIYDVVIEAAKPFDSRDAAKLLLRNLETFHHK